MKLIGKQQQILATTQRLYSNPRTKTTLEL